jgi:hypothetical protein
MALQPRIIACGNKVATFAMAVRFLTGPAVMAAASFAVGLRGTLLHVAIVQVKLSEPNQTNQPHKQTHWQARTPLTRAAPPFEKEMKKNISKQRSSGRPGMPIDMPPVPVKRGTASFRFWTLHAQHEFALFFFFLPPPLPLTDVRFVY